MENLPNSIKHRLLIAFVPEQKGGKFKLADMGYSYYTVNGKKVEIIPTFYFRNKKYIKSEQEHSQLLNTILDEILKSS